MSSTSDNEDVLPLVEEKLSVGKQTVETGRVRIKTVLDERQEWLHESLAREAVSIERVTINQVVDTPPEIRQQGDVLIIPLVEEVLVAEKKLLLKEEIHVRKERYVDEVDEPITLKSTRAVIERE